MKKILKKAMKAKAAVGKAIKSAKGPIKKAMKSKSVKKMARKLSKRK